jgi:prolyl 4-hydroxylase
VKVEQKNSGKDENVEETANVGTTSKIVAPSSEPTILWNRGGGLFALAFFLLGLSTSWIQEVWIDRPFWSSQYSRAVVNGSRRPMSGGSPVVLTPAGPAHPCHPKDGILHQFLHDRSEPGLHLVCIRENVVTFFRGARHGDNETVGALGNEPSQVPNDGIRSLDAELFKDYLDLKDDSAEEAQDRFLEWAAFSTEGERLFDAQSFDAQVVRDQGLVLVLEVGVWRWPGVRVGFQRRVDVPGANLTFLLETLSLSPLVLATTGFLTESECLEIQRVAEPHLRYSDVSLMDKDAGRPATDFRTSSSVFLRHGTRLLQELNDRTAAFLRIPRTHQEHLQVLRYYTGEKYDQHDDFFDPRQYQNDATTLALTKRGRRNRFATFFWYLSDVSSGGETSFPKVEGREPRTLLDCDGTDALLVKPQRGKVVLFYSMRADGRLDPRSTHAACPVGPENVKWASNKWVWNQPMNYVR